jgi:hypothetical protein
MLQMRAIKKRVGLRGAKSARGATTVKANPDDFPGNLSNREILDFVRRVLRHRRDPESRAVAIGI